MQHHTSKAQLTAASSRLDILSFKHSSELQLEEIIQALFISILQNLQAGIQTSSQLLPTITTLTCSQQVLLKDGWWALPTDALLPQYILPVIVSLVSGITGFACFTSSYPTWLWNQVTPVVSGMATWCLLPLTFSYSPFSRCCCYSSDFNSTGFMHF